MVILKTWPVFLFILLVVFFSLSACTSDSTTPTTKTLNEQLVAALENELSYIRSTEVLCVTEYKEKKMALFFYKVGALDYQGLWFFENEENDLQLTSGVGGSPVTPGAEMFTLSGSAPHLSNGQEFGIVYGQLLSQNIARMEVTFMDGKKVYHDINNEKGFIVAHDAYDFEQKPSWWVKEIKAFDDEDNLIYTFPSD